MENADQILFSSTYVSQLLLDIVKLNQELYLKFDLLHNVLSIDLIKNTHDSCCSSFSLTVNCYP